MPAYSSQKLQHLDIGCFSHLKQVYGTLVEQKRYLEVKNINKFNSGHPHLQAGGSL